MTERVRARRVLLVDDNAADASVIARFLARDEGEGYEIFSATSGEEGLEAVRSSAPDVVLLDYDLPDLTGLEFLDELRRFAPDGSAPVVLAITGQSNPRVAADLIRRGALDYLSKDDLTGDTVRIAVRQAMRTRAMRADLHRMQREREASHADLIASLERASYLASVSELLMRSLDVSAVLETVALLAIPYLADACFVDVLAGDTLVRRVVEISEPLRRRLPDRAALLREPDADGDEGVGRVLRSKSSASYGRAWLHAAARWDPALGQLIAHAPIESLIVVPLLFDGKPLGTLSFASLRPHEPEATHVAEELARRTSAAFANARAFEIQRAAVESTEAARRRLHIVSRASEVFARSLDWRDVMQALVGVLVPALCDHVTVIVDDGTGAEIVASTSVDPALEALVGEAAAGVDDVRAMRAGVGPVLRTGRATYYPDAQDLVAVLAADRSNAARMRVAQTYSTYMAVPMPGANGTVAGALSLAGTGTRRFALDDLAVAEDIGRRAGMYLENVRLFERERDIARTLQKSLLPIALPTLPSVEIAAHVVAGVEGVDVAGDWYDVVPLPLGRVAFAIGDVAGRGVQAAATMGQLRSSLRAYVLEGLEPSDALARLNGFVLSQERMQFATVAVGVLDTETGTLRYASAGHLPPLLVGAGGPHLLETARSLPVGVMTGEYYEQSQHQLDPGDVLALYTDGLVESRTRAIQDGFTSLLALAGEERSHPQQLVDDLLEHLASDAGDDVTILALRFAPQGGMAARPAAGPVFAATYPALRASAPIARRRLRRYLAGVAIDTARLGDVLLAAGEAVANAVEHAYHGAVQAGIFTMRAECDGVRLVVDVIDHGIWRQRGAEPPAALSERGRGFTLMHALCDDVHVHHDEGGTAVRLAFALRRPEGA